jgi:hypothetical protein
MYCQKLLRWTPVWKGPCWFNPLHCISRLDHVYCLCKYFRGQAFHQVHLVQFDQYCRISLSSLPKARFYCIQGILGRFRWYRESHQELQRYEKDIWYYRCSENEQDWDSWRTIDSRGGPKTDITNSECFQHLLDGHLTKIKWNYNSK